MRSNAYPNSARRKSSSSRCAATRAFHPLYHVTMSSFAAALSVVRSHSKSTDRQRGKNSPLRRLVRWSRGNTDRQLRSATRSSIFCSAGFTSMRWNCLASLPAIALVRAWRVLASKTSSQGRTASICFCAVSGFMAPRACSKRRRMIGKRDWIGALKCGSHGWSHKSRRHGASRAGLSRPKSWSARFNLGKTTTVKRFSRASADTSGDAPGLAPCRLSTSWMQGSTWRHTSQ
mmetsp:Transcript_75/g.247  ORF Transcript_75/g.247 Transcript_75/m.247 type:complete len:232 (-) Transcript_75:1642-2337(-)